MIRTMDNFHIRCASNKLTNCIGPSNIESLQRPSPFMFSLLSPTEIFTLLTRPSVLLTVSKTLASLQYTSRLQFINVHLFPYIAHLKNLHWQLPTLSCNDVVKVLSFLVTPELLWQLLYAKLWICSLLVLSEERARWRQCCAGFHTDQIGVSGSRLSGLFKLSRVSSQLLTMAMAL